MAEHRHPANIARHDGRSFGDRVADATAAFVGSWKFIILQTALMIIWMVVNTQAIVALLHVVGVAHSPQDALVLMINRDRWDPFPFVFLNLFMSAEAAYATPIILMSQNRQAEHDRVRAEHDYETNERSLAWNRAIGAHLGVEPPDESFAAGMYAPGASQEENAP
ncbi:DUF1003 domain-containing protein [Kitasatospora sp. NPDC094028]